MSQRKDRLKEWLLMGGFLLLVVVALPALGILVFVGRFVVVAAFLALLAGGIVAAVVSPGFRQWLASQTAMQTSYKGLHLDSGVALHPSHCWARIDPDQVVVGVDDVVQTLLGPIESVEFPPLGSRVGRGDRLFQLRRGDRSLEMPSPVSGTVVGQNGALLERPWLVNQAPFSKGWVVRLRGDRPWADRRRLLRGTRAQHWFRREVDRMISILLPEAEGEKSLAPSLADGGSLVTALYRQIDHPTWMRLKADFFSPGRQKMLKS